MENLEDILVISCVLHEKMFTTNELIQAFPRYSYMKASDIRRWVEHEDLKTIEPMVCVYI